MREQTCDLEGPLAAPERIEEGEGQNQQWKSLLQTCHHNLGYRGLSCSMGVAVGGGGRVRKRQRSGHNCRVLHPLEMAADDSGAGCLLPLVGATRGKPEGQDGIFQGHQETKPTL